MEQFLWGKRESKDLRHKECVPAFAQKKAKPGMGFASKAQ
jgi:hypothetical protein